MIAVLFILSITLLFGVGVVLIIGTLKGVQILIDPPVSWYSLYPYWFLKRIGRKAIYYFHILVGAIFILGAIYLFVYGIIL